jgi:lipopolysaccharide/colanic/teichoic acid biosynthesis glycosyltransferase
MNVKSLSRIVDLVVAALGLVLVGPVIGGVSLLVYLSSPGPIVVRDRLPQAGRSDALILTFRTVYSGSTKLTPVGRFLRQTSLEWLPALVSVLTGDMTFRQLNSAGRLNKP